MKNKGLVFAVVTAFISGISIFSNSVFVSTMNPVAFTFIRNTIVAVMLTIVLVMSGRRGEVHALAKNDWAKLALIGIVGGGIPFAMFFSGLSMIGAVNGNILQKTLFLWVALLAVPVLKEKISIIQLAGYSVLFLGLFVFGGTFTMVPAVGSYLILGATVLWAVEQVIAKITLKNVSPLLVAWSRMVFGLPCLLIYMAATGTVSSLLAITSALVVPCVVSSVLLVAYMGTWYNALSRAPATFVSSILVFAPVVTMLLGAGVFHKTITEQQVFNMVFLTLGLVLVSIDAVIRQRQRIGQPV